MNNRPNGSEKPLFTHVVLFRCPDSGDPIGTAFVSQHKNLEAVDSHRFDVQCVCGWSGNLLGLDRVNGRVESWPESRSSPSDPPSQLARELASGLTVGRPRAPSDMPMPQGKKESYSYPSIAGHAPQIGRAHV